MTELGTEFMFPESSTLNTVYSPKKSDNFFWNWRKIIHFLLC